MRSIITICAALLMAGASAPQTRAPESVTGSWELTIKGPAAHGDLTATMELKQDGKKVTGSFTAHGNTHTLSGAFTGRELELQTTDTPPDHAITMNARLADDGTLSGYLSSPMGDMKWTASRKDGNSQSVPAGTVR